MSEPVVVVGAGLAGVAAAWAAHAGGVPVRLFDVRLGASALGAGAVDELPWESLARAHELCGTAPTARPLAPDVEQLAAELGIWRLAAPGDALPRLATEAGRIRLARGSDRALLDLSRLPDGARVVLPRAARAEWDADGLARALGDDPYARARALVFAAADAEVVRFVGEERIASGDFAQRHDEPARRQWLGDRMHELVGLERRDGRRVDALLLGPWLGADEPRADALAQQLGLPVGELLVGVGCAAGLRFEAARERLLARLRIDREPRAVRAVRRADKWLQVELDADVAPVTARAVVLAIGGLGAGGLRYVPPESDATADEPPNARAALALDLEAPVTLQAGGEPVGTVSSWHGPTLDDEAWPTGVDPSWLESLGIDAPEGLAAPGIYAAGDVVAGRPRTRLEAVGAGARAGRAAARFDT